MWHLTNKVFEDTVENFAYAKNVFSEEEIDKIIELGLSKQSHKGLVGSDEGKTNEKIRKCKTSWINADNDSEWLYRKITDIINRANKDYFDFELCAMMEDLQFTIYDGKKTKYTSHIDKVKNATARKLSVVIQLSDPKDYSGGDLELFPTSLEATKIEKEKGLICFFPSYVLHRVQPVTKGTRYSLVVWVHGPKFR